MASLSISIERLVSEGDYCNYKVGCSVSDEVRTGESLVMAVTRLHAQCHDYVRWVTEARSAEVERQGLLLRAEALRESAERELEYARLSGDEDEEWVERKRKSAQELYEKAAAAQDAAAEIRLDEDWLPF